VGDAERCHLASLQRDGYGEHEDGSPFDGTGIGRGWPLLTGERAHYELAAGREAIAQILLSAMESFANESGFIPSKSGILLTCQNTIFILAGLLVRPCRWSGRTPSI